MEKEIYQSDDPKDAQGTTVRLEKQEFESGYSSYVVRVNPEFTQMCYEHDKPWDEDFRRNIGPNYPYTMSPKTSELIATTSTELKKEMSRVGFQIDPWKVGADDEPYVMGVLRRVMVTDTIEPILSYTDEVASHLKGLKEKDPSKVLNIRSFFCGAAVADKSLISRLYESGVSANLIATDIAADSIAIAALNFSVWNELLPESDRYEIHIVKGSIPRELYGRDKTIVLQVEDALNASNEEKDLNVAFDALVLDNGLQYVSQEFTRGLLSNVSHNVGSDGLYVGALGLDSQIKVEIPKFYHLTQIIDSKFRDLRKVYAQKSKFQAPYGYPHTYNFKVDKNTGMIVIDGVVSDGAARMYTWLGKLLVENRPRFKEVMAAIKSATDLSRANRAVETTPFDYHNVMVDALKQGGKEVEVIERPLEFEKYGWTEVGEDRYSNGKEEVDGGTMMRLCKEKDPLVLRTSRILVK
ncbi:hypothetical protein CVU76_01230 [Candidatus Dojkabacteria bacterium HGW-Dojkabacteria-1]|uniref:Uncharacterized protein n=1 Tax=Candidatus Dojkabacteria bacterium HGW-Dojkabacteria-1 TaxID=2013761 RepID=A0A2N2F347_9BACT|nr:MAG: hypothetical protein CVU76_01230 [Candidatus Dojkabacteria bacterium HGW-Dojkabacteria-1]